MGIYAYLYSVTPTVEAVKLKGTSPFDPTNFVDFGLNELFLQ